MNVYQMDRMEYKKERATTELVRTLADWKLTDETWSYIVVSAVLVVVGVTATIISLSAHSGSPSAFV
jgi:hypothetical protein